MFSVLINDIIRFDCAGIQFFIRNYFITVTFSQKALFPADKRAVRFIKMQRHFIIDKKTESDLLACINHAVTLYCAVTAGFRSQQPQESANQQCGAPKQRSQCFQPINRNAHYELPDTAYRTERDQKIQQIAQPEPELQAQRGKKQTSGKVEQQQYNCPE